MVRRRTYRKRSKSKTRKGHLDFVTHKGSKRYNRRGHRQKSSQSKHRYKPFK